MIVAGRVNGPTEKWRSYLLQRSGSRVIPQAAIKASFSSDGSTWETMGWSILLDEKHIGDGITVNNGIVSVPEYEGATTSSAGTAGLVPPATAGQQESFLTGGGEYKPALTKISDSVNLADSKTAASAKAVKTAYDLANSKQANLGFTPVQQSGGAGQEGQKIYIGWSPSGLKAQADALDLGNIVTTSAGCTKAPSAANADHANTANGIGSHSWHEVMTVGNPHWVVGLATDGSNQIKPFNPYSLRVDYAHAAGTVPNVAFVGRGGAIPNGGTWLYIYVPYDSHHLSGVHLAGGATAPSNDGGIAIRVA